jgi:hypothetical protein
MKKHETRASKVERREREREEIKEDVCNGRVICKQIGGRKICTMLFLTDHEHGQRGSCLIKVNSGRGRTDGKVTPVELIGDDISVRMCENRDVERQNVMRSGSDEELDKVD